MIDNYEQNYKIGKSNIHGNGVIAKKNILKHNIIGIAMVFSFIIIPYITEDLGQWINHSYGPNAYIYYYMPKNVYYLIANRNIQKGEEITMDYNDTPWYIRKPDADYI